MKHVKLKPIVLRSHPQLDERWVQDVIADDPTLLGLGDVVLKDRERMQKGAGRLDLLLQDAEGHGRYEVEIQLGATDPSHIIRTIEYWEMERKRYPQYDHTAVIIAEDITSRFLSVISLFNGAIPIIAIQMTAVEMGDGAGLFFTRVLDTLQLGLVDEDEEINDPADRAYWENRATPKTVKLAEKIPEFCREFAGDIQLNFNRHYIGMQVDGKACNFVTVRPRKSHLIVEIALRKSDEIDEELSQHDLDLLEYDNRSRRYRVRLSEADLTRHEGVIKSLLERALALRQD
ncbi:hypothetical protein VSU19_16550 [Verrucomicrobiales bacterium BCK34]|nr:hypothetical protein [Verrucomicrobiales bacterium BCK34]